MLIILSLFLMLSIYFLSADQISSPNYKTDAIISGGGAYSSSFNYQLQTVSDILTGSASSDSYKQSSFLSIPLTPVKSSTVTSSSSGGSTTTSSPLIKIASFKLNTTFLPIEVKKGEQKTEVITLTNDGTKNLTISISITGIKRFVFPRQDSIFLEPGETKFVKFDLYAFTNVNPDIYLGQISFNAENITKSVNVVLNIKNKLPLFDIKTTVLSKKVYPGTKVSAKVIVKNLGDNVKVDIQLESVVEDFQNRTYISKIETFAITNSSTKEVFLELPSNISLGNYIFYSKVSYGNITASSYDTFSVVKKENWIILKIMGGIISLLILIWLVIKIISIRIKKDIEWRERNRIWSN